MSVASPAEEYPAEELRRLPRAVMAGALAMRRAGMTDLPNAPAEEEAAYRMGRSGRAVSLRPQPSFGAGCRSFAPKNVVSMCDGAEAPRR